MTELNGYTGFFGIHVLVQASSALGRTHGQVENACGDWILHLRLQPSVLFEFSTISVNVKQWFVLHCISPGFFCSNFAKAPSTSICDKRIRAPKPLYISGIVRAHSILEQKFTSRCMTVTSRFARKSGHRGPTASSTQVRSLKRTRFVRGIWID